ncbi:MAG: GSCFA domain-containing protein [Bacteroidales bacterium]|nr:GSCFA domain-containing protein [Bacteroidales bacterium]
MKFRTEIGEVKGGFAISHDDRIVMLGSCFSDNIGSRLEAEGFTVTHNPLGPLYNPASIARITARGGRPYRTEDLIEYQGEWHCLDMAWRYHDTDRDRLLERINADYLPLADAIDRCTVLILTMGTARVYIHGGITAGNCHKLPASMFEQRDLRVNEIYETLTKALPAGKRLIFTLSPVRYPSYGLACDSLSKATLRVALDDVCRDTGADYFPAYEIINDDLRDYRFYAADLKHPSEVAVEYIYQHFADAYFDNATRQRAAECHRAYLRGLHRQITNTTDE